MAQYRIEWKCLKLNYGSHGEWYDSKKILEQWVEHLNKEHRDEIHHWIVTK